MKNDRGTPVPTSTRDRILLAGKEFFATHGYENTMEGLLRDKILATRVGYPASFGSDDIRKLFLHVLQSFSTPVLRMVPPARAHS